MAFKVLKVQVCVCVCVCVYFVLEQSHVTGMEGRITQK